MGNFDEVKQETTRREETHEEYRDRWLDEARVMYAADTKRAAAAFSAFFSPLEDYCRCDEHREARLERAAKVAGEATVNLATGHEEPWLSDEMKAAWEARHKGAPRAAIGVDAARPGAFTIAFHNKGDGPIRLVGLESVAHGFDDHEIARWFGVPVHLIQKRQR